MTERNRIIPVSVLAIIVIIAWFAVRPKRDILQVPADSDVTAPDAVENPAPTPVSSGTDPAAGFTPNGEPFLNVDGFVPPLARAGERVTKKPFGIYITKATSPVRPERFSGYHTGADFEIFSDETDADVSVSAICSGRLLMKRFASGYGGVVVQSCMYDGYPVTVVYGHLRLSSISKPVGGQISAGDHLGILGAGYSAETNGERKHLHLGIRKGSQTDIRGYASSKAELSGWFDPCLLVCHS